MRAGRGNPPGPFISASDPPQPGIPSPYRMNGCRGEAGPRGDARDVRCIEAA